MRVKVRKLVENAVIPTYAKQGDAGLDLTATKVEIKGDKVKYYSGLAIEIPAGFVGLLFPRSSNAKKDLLLTNSVGVIDSGFRGEITAVFVANDDKEESIYKVCELVAQLVILPYPKIELEEADELSATERGCGGYGSTGK